jgi:hypothetical protein
MWIKRVEGGLEVLGLHQIRYDVGLVPYDLAWNISGGVGSGAPSWGDLDVRRLGPSTRRTIVSIGALGHLARAAALAVVGLLVGSAAVFVDPRRAGGPDDALRALGETRLGTVLLVVVALGFAAYGVYCLADAATRRA